MCEHYHINKRTLSLNNFKWCGFFYFKDEETEQLQPQPGLAQRLQQLCGQKIHGGRDREGHIFSGCSTSNGCKTLG